MDRDRHRGSGAPDALRRALGGPLLLLGVALSLPGTVQARQAATLCIVSRSPAAGLGFRDVVEALDVEWRKSRLPLQSEVVAAPAAEACPAASEGPSALLLLTGANAVLLGPGGVTLSLDLRDVSEADRGQDIARRIAGVFAVEMRDGRPLLVDARQAPPGAGRRGADPATAGYLALSGRYAYQSGRSGHRFATDLEGGVSLHDERLAAGLRVGLEPRQQTAGTGVPVRVLAVPVTATVRGGGRLHPRVLLRGALGVGLEWRQSEAAVPDGGPPRRVREVVPLVEAEAEALFAPARGLRLGIAGILRGFLGGDALSWQGRVIQSAPRVGVGLVLRIGLVVPDRGARP